MRWQDNNWLLLCTQEMLTWSSYLRNKIALSSLIVQVLLSPPPPFFFLCGGRLHPVVLWGPCGAGDQTQDSCIQCFELPPSPIIPLLSMRNCVYMIWVRLGASSLRSLVETPSWTCWIISQLPALSLSLSVVSGFSLKVVEKKSVS